MTHVELHPDFPEDMTEVVDACAGIVDLAKDYINGGGTSIYWEIMAKKLRFISKYTADHLPPPPVKKGNAVVEETLEDSP